VGDEFCIPDAITNALSDSTVYAPIATADQALSWKEEDSKGVTAPRTASTSGKEHTDLNAFLRSLCDANGGTHIEVIAAACTASAVPTGISQFRPRLPPEAAPRDELPRMHTVGGPGWGHLRLPRPTSRDVDKGGGGGGHHCKRHR
jgi:hypothetical protein